MFLYCQEQVSQCIMLYACLQVIFLNYCGVQVYRLSQSCHVPQQAFDLYIQKKSLRILFR